MDRQGLYVSKWREIVTVKGLAPIEIMEVTRFFASLEGQIPSEVKVAAHKYRLPWAQAEGECQMFEKNIWHRTVECGASLWDSNCLRSLCNEYWRQSYDGVRADCGLQSLNSLFAVEWKGLCQQLRSTNAVRDASPLSASTARGTMAVVMAMGDDGLDLERVRHLPVGLLPKDVAALREIVSLSRNAFDAAAVASGRREVLAPSIDVGAGLPLSASEELAVYSLPNTNSPRIFADIGTGMDARLDCTNRSVDWDGSELRRDSRISTGGGLCRMGDSLSCQEGDGSS